MVFCQFSGCDSVRDISNGLKSATGNLNHLGISRAPSKSTVSYQNTNRDSDVSRDIFYAVYKYFGQQGWGSRKGFRFKMPIKLLDSTLVSLTMSVYDWAHYTSKKGAVKMHTLLDYDCLLPDFVNIRMEKAATTRLLSTFPCSLTPSSLPIVDTATMLY